MIHDMELIVLILRVSKSANGETDVRPLGPKRAFAFTYNSFIWIICGLSGRPEVMPCSNMFKRHVS